MSSRAAWLMMLVVLLAALGSPSHAQAQMRFRVKDVETQVDASEVEVGGVVHVTLNVSSESVLPDRPELGAHAGFTVRGPSVSPTQMSLNLNGVRSVRRGISATWTLQATAPGTFTVGPPSAYVGQQRVTSDPVRIHVVKHGALAGNTDPFGTLDPWKSFFGVPDQQTARQPPPADPALALDHDDTQPIFVHASLDKSTAVVGEQVTYTALLYVDPEMSDQDFITEHEASAASFLRRPLVADDTSAKLLGYGKVRSRVYRVKQLPKVAFFPLTTGALEIGEQELRYPLGNRYVSLKTGKLVVTVSEPPTRGRPRGYALGDTGRFELSSEVKPREIEQGDVTAVTVTLNGTGNVPRAQLPLPVQRDVSFMQPELSEKLGVAEKERFAAVDTFRYIVRLEREGDVDLGSIELPFWDPDRKVYGTAKAYLGVVHVKRGDAHKAAPADPNPVVLPDAPPPMDAFDGVRPASARHLADGAVFWWSLAGSPLAYGLWRVGGVAVSRLRRRREERAAAPDAELERRRADARAKAKGTSGKELVAAVKRFVLELPLAHAGVNVKSEPAEHAAELLAEADVPSALATETGALLVSCADLAFSPDDVPLAEARALFDRAEALDRAFAKEAAS